MNHKQIIELINEAEIKYDVDKWEIEDIKIWPIVRLELFFYLRDQFTKKNAFVKTSKGSKLSLMFIFKILTKLFKLFYAKIVDFKHNEQTSKKADVLILSHSFCRFAEIDGKKYDVFVDPLRDILISNNLSSFVLEYSTGEYRIPRYGLSHYFDLSKYLFKVQQKLFINPQKMLFDGIDEYEDFIQFVEGRTKIDIPLKIDFIKNKIFELLKLSNYFEKMIKKLSPSIAFSVCYYNIIGMSLNLACKRLGIPSVDIQHGVQGDFHPAYGRWLKIPSQGYELLSYYFWCWGESEYQANREWSKQVNNFHVPIIIGNLYLNKFKGDSEVSAYFDDIIRSLLHNKDITCNILLSLQPITGFSDLLQKLIKCSPKTWFWWIRVHPSMLNNKDDLIQISNNLGAKYIDIENASKLPLPSLLRFMNVHITESSSVVIEAEQFGVPSIVINKISKEYYKNQISSGYAVYANNIQDILLTIEKMNDKKHQDKYQYPLKHSVDDQERESINKIIELIKKHKKYS